MWCCSHVVVVEGVMESGIKRAPNQNEFSMGGAPRRGAKRAQRAGGYVQRGNPPYYGLR